MPLMELVRTVLAVGFAVVALYSAARLALSFAPAGTVAGAGVMRGERASDATHALVGFALAVIVWPHNDDVPAILGVLVFATLAAWLATILRQQGAMSCGGNDGRGGHGGYNLHHFVGCVAMLYVYATGHLSGGQVTGGATAAEPAGSPALMTQHVTGPLTGISWLFGLYFLVAATSLGFRVAEPIVRITHHATVPAAAGFQPAVAARAVPARLFSSSAGLCATEVVVSCGMAFMFFSSL